MVVSRRVGGIGGNQIGGVDPSQTGIWGIVSIGRRVIQRIPQFERLAFRRAQPEQGTTENNEKRGLTYRSHIFGSD